MSMRTVGSMGRSNFRTGQSGNHLGHESQLQHLREEDSTLANLENVSFEDEINFLGDGQFSPTLREE